MTTPFYPNQSLSHGTMRNEDLLQSFGSALERAAEQSTLPHPLPKRHADLAGEAFALIENGNADTEAGSDVVNEMFDALDYYAPAGCAFGSHEGDGSDYGFWQIDEESDA